jgi:hypothetical protein
MARTTRLGHIVHRNTMDHHRDDTRYQRFNKRVAMWLVSHVGTMSCFWVFTLIALFGLPATVVAVGLHLHLGRLQWLTAGGFILLVQWVAQSYLQLVLLPGLMVGQNLQSAANDVRATKTFEDTEAILDRLSLDTEGGLKSVLDAIAGLNAKVDALAGHRS